MKVLLLAQFSPPVIGGEERHVRNLAVALAQRGLDVHVGTLRTDRGAPVQDPGVTVHVLDHLGDRMPGLYPTADRPLALPVPDPYTTRDLSRLARRLRPDVVHSHNWIVNSWVALPTAHRLPLVHSLHDYSHVCATKRLMFEGAPCSGPAPSKCLPCAGDHYGAGRGQVIWGTVRAGLPVRRHAVDLFTAVSSFVAGANQLEEAGVPWQVVPNFVPDSFTSRARMDRDPALPDAPYLFFAGDLSDQKGVPTLVEAWRRLPEESRPELVMVGRPSSDLSELPAGVHVHHHWDHERVVSGFQHALAAVLPSEWPDPCPTTVLEAMALGVPLVTTHQGGIADMVVDRESALVVRPGDAGHLASALAEVVADDGLRRRLAAQASVEVGRYLQGRVAEDFDGIYRELVAAAG